MLFYSYCPECGTESRPFRSEPKDGTPMVCPYCGKTYGYKTRHWMAQRVFLRSIFTLVVIGLIVNGCVGGCKKKSMRDRIRESVKVENGMSVENMGTADESRSSEMVRKNAAPTGVAKDSTPTSKKRPYQKKSIKLGVEKIDVKNGLCPGYEWGSGKKMDGRMTFQLNRQLAWDEVEVTYKRGVGLHSFSLKRKGLWNVECEDFVKNNCAYIVRDAGKISYRSYTHLLDKTLYLTVTLPKNDYRVIVTTKDTHKGKMRDLTLSVTNKRFWGDTKLDDEEIYKALGFSFDCSGGEGIQKGTDGRERIVFNGIVYESPETKKKEEPESRRSRRMKERMLKENEDKKSDNGNGFIDVDI